MSQAEHNKELLVRLTEIVNQGDLDAIGEVATGQIAAEAARLDRTVPANPFPTLKMELVNATAEDDKVVGHFKCSGIHRGKWRGTGPTGRRFENIDEIYILRVEDRTLATVLVVVEDNLTRLQQTWTRYGAVPLGASGTGPEPTSFSFPPTFPRRSASADKARRRRQ